MRSEVLVQLLANSATCREFFHNFYGLSKEEREPLTSEYANKVRDLLLSDIQRIKTFVIDRFRRKRIVRIYNLNNLLTVQGEIWHPRNSDRRNPNNNVHTIESAFDLYHTETLAEVGPLIKTNLFNAVLNRCRFLSQQCEPLLPMIFNLGTVETFLGEKDEICSQLLCSNDWLCEQLLSLAKHRMYKMLVIVIRNPKRDDRYPFFSFEERKHIVDMFYNLYRNRCPNLRFQEALASIRSLLALHTRFTDALLDWPSKTCLGIDKKTFSACTKQVSRHRNSRFCTYHHGFNGSQNLFNPTHDLTPFSRISISGFFNRDAALQMYGWVDYVLDTTYNNNKNTILELNDQAGSSTSGASASKRRRTVYLNYSYN